MSENKQAADSTKRAPGQGGNRALYWLREERGVAGETDPTGQTVAVSAVLFGIWCGRGRFPAIAFA
ncbi:hypothetical protein MTBSS4_30190 [Magnetospirillum sp. SS-4]|nr:hypothetical protein MTBSS4_30190 [Magnetospirillum sp. SS-4]